MGTKHTEEPLDFRLLNPDLMDDLRSVLRGTWGGSCWCMHPRLTDKQLRALPGDGALAPRRRTAMTALAARARSPGLLAYRGEVPVGWVAVAPREELARIEVSRATPRVDATAVWVIPCITVRKSERGQGTALALIRAAVGYAFGEGAPAVEAYPRAGSERTKDDNAYYGTEPLFRRAGFRIVRGPLENVPRNWTQRPAMRIKA